MFQASSMGDLCFFTEQHETSFLFALSFLSLTAWPNPIISPSLREIMVPMQVRCFFDPLYQQRQLYNIQYEKDKVKKEQYINHACISRLVKRPVEQFF